MNLGTLIEWVGKELMAAIVAKVVQLVLRQMSGEIKAGICKALRELKAKAKTTDNPWDDVVVEFLLNLFGCDE